jgi:hypothetical protein
MVDWLFYFVVRSENLPGRFTLDIALAEIYYARLVLNKLGVHHSETFRMLLHMSKHMF